MPRPWIHPAAGRSGIAYAMLIAVMCGAFPHQARAQMASSAPLISLDSLLNTRISAASKYAQTSAEAPASVTILTAEDLERYGYSRLDEVFESIRGFYISNDRNYSYLGTRGFSRPTDYNNRVLLLIDGHTMNDQTWGAAPMGGDLPLNISAIERIEVIRGPGSALYGTSAMFAVINVVTRRGRALDGVIASGRVGTQGEHEIGLALGTERASGLSVSASGILREVAGPNLYYPEYDTPATNNGVAVGGDWDHASSGIVAASYADVSIHGGILSRTKGIPTGSFETAFNDRRNARHDERGWADLGIVHEFSARFRATARAYGDWYSYHGAYPGDTPTLYTDGGGSESFGAELLGIAEFSSRDRLTLGTEYRRVVHANYFERFPDGTTTSDNAPFKIESLYAENEHQFSSSLSLVSGLRIDRNSRHGTERAPRLALILTPDTATVLKLLYGESFRAPSAAEADLSTSFYQRNPSLKPERARTIEFAFTRRLVPNVLLSGSLYGYYLTDLIDQADITGAGVLEYHNLQNAEGTGAEIEVDARPSQRLQLHASYAVERAEREPGDVTLTNMPVQILIASSTIGISESVHATLSTRYESGRLTISGASTSSFFRSDAAATWHAPRFLAPEVGLRATNLLNTYYAVPGGLEHRQDSLQQDGRRITLHVNWHL